MPADRSFFQRHAVAAAVLALAAAVVATGLLSRQSQAEELRTAVAERTLPTERRAVMASQRASDLAETRYREGATSYLEVVTAQAALLQARRSGLDLETRQRRATVQLVRALGGAWSATDPPQPPDALASVDSIRTGTTR